MAAIASAFGLPVRTAAPEDLDEQLHWALGQSGPAVVVLRTEIAAALPTA